MCLGIRVTDPHHSNADLDPSFYFNAVPGLTCYFVSDPDPDNAFFKIMRICDYWSTEYRYCKPLWAPFGASMPSLLRLHFEPQKLPNFGFNADPDPGSQNYADPYGSGSATLTVTLVPVLYIRTKFNFCFLFRLSSQITEEDALKISAKESASLEDQHLAEALARYHFNNIHSKIVLRIHLLVRCWQCNKNGGIVS